MEKDTKEAVRLYELAAGQGIAVDPDKIIQLKSLSTSRVYFFGVPPQTPSQNNTQSENITPIIPTDVIPKGDDERKQKP